MGSKDIEIRVVEFVTKTQFLCRFKSLKPCLKKFAKMMLERICNPNSEFRSWKSPNSSSVLEV